MNMDNRTKYLERELWILAWNASVQHAAVYKKGLYQTQREQINIFRGKIISYIKDHLIPEYREEIKESSHCLNIERLIDYAIKVDTGVLGKDGYKYGIAQKLLNLSLKYYWCLGLIAEPPHCPIDMIIIDKTEFKGKINWTQMLTEREYLDIISAIRILAKMGNCSIAQWELNNYERR